MSDVSLRLTAFNQLCQAITDAFPGALLLTSDAAPVDESALPAIRVMDGGHQTSEGPVLGHVTMACSLEVTWYAEFADEPTSPALDAHAKLAAALSPTFVLPNGYRYEVIESEYQPDTEGPEEAAGRIASFRASYRYEIETPIGVFAVTV